LRRVLVLNATYEPLSVVPMPRAIHLLLSEKAEVIESDGLVIHSQSMSFSAPVVIRLQYYVHIPHNLPMPLSRRAILLRDSFTCQYCGTQPGREHLTIDHILPRSRGGRTDWENTVAACGACNRKKGNRTPEEAHMPLLRQPVRPRFWAMALIMGPGHDAWRKYLFIK
jgi:5-methylcytosine-specific restriction endonuclease McrA